MRAFPGRETQWLSAAPMGLDRRIALSAYSCKDSHGFGQQAARTAFRFFSLSQGTGAIDETTLTSRSAPTGSASGGCCQSPFRKCPLARYLSLGSLPHPGRLSTGKAGRLASDVMEMRVIGTTGNIMKRSPMHLVAYHAAQSHMPAAMAVPARIVA